MKLLRDFVILLLILSVTFYLALGWQITRQRIVDDDDPDFLALNARLGLDASAAVIIHSYHPSANWSGDYQKMFAVQYPAQDLQAAIMTSALPRGDQLSESELAALHFLDVFIVAHEWFPAVSQMQTADYRIHLIQIRQQTDYVDSGRLVALHAESGTAYFIAAKM